MSQQKNLQPPPQLAEPADPLPQRLQAIREMDLVQFNLWRQHPVSKVVLGFLADYAEALATQATAQWIENGVPLEHQAEARGRILANREMVALRLTDIQAFYGEQNDDR